MGVVTDLKMSDQEVQDALNLEKLYSIVKKSRASCCKCGRYPTHLDCTNYKFLCSAHAVGRPPTCKQIGVDRFNSIEIQKLQKKIGTPSNSSSRRSKSSHTTYSRRHQSSHRSPRNRKKRSSSTSSEDSFGSQSDSEENFRLPPPRSQKSSSSWGNNNFPESNTSSQPTFASSFNDPVPAIENTAYNNSFGQQARYPPGMAGILMQTQSYPPTTNQQQSIFREQFPSHASQMNPNFNFQHMSADPTRMMSNPGNCMGMNSGHFNLTGGLSLPGQFDQSTYFMNQPVQPKHNLFQKSYNSNVPNDFKLSNIPNNMMSGVAPNMFMNQNTQQGSSLMNPQIPFNSYQYRGLSQQPSAAFDQFSARPTFNSINGDVYGAKPNSRYPQMHQSPRATNPFDNPATFQQNRPSSLNSQFDIRPFDNFSNNINFSKPQPFQQPDKSFDSNQLTPCDSTYKNSWYQNPAMMSNLQHFQSIPSNVSPRIPNVTPGQKDWWD